MRKGIVPSSYYIMLMPLLVVLWSSCRKDFEYAPSSGSLEFSLDTVFLDTIFSNIGSSTYTLKVYNRSKDDIEIPTIQLASGETSAYRLNVDGSAGKTFENVPQLAEDSLFIFIETTVDIADNGTTFLYTDALQFDTGANQQEVQLVTLVRDAIFIFPPTDADGNKATLSLGLDDQGNELRVTGVELNDDQLDFTSEKPYVVYGYAAVPENKTLTMAPGTRVHFHDNSGIWVRPNASLEVRGELSNDTLLLENEVIFEGDRLEPEFEAVPGQWGTIWLSEGSVNNTINHLTLKNATIGLLVEGGENATAPTLLLRNSRIYNSASVNLWARTARIAAENVVLGGAGAIALYCNLGGEYTFNHTTIANYWSNGFRTGEALRIDNAITLPNGQGLQADLTKAAFTNSIIDGNGFAELALFDNGINNFDFSLTDCMLQYNETTEDPLFDFEDSRYYNGLLLNEEADFKAPAKNDFRLGAESSAIGKGNTEAAQRTPFDILGTDRTARPDLGAYQAIPEN